MKIVINESDLKKVINTINSEEHAITELKERYSNMSDDDKELCVSLIEYFNPHLKLGFSNGCPVNKLYLLASSQPQIPSSPLIVIIEQEFGI